MTEILLEAVAAASEEQEQTLSYPERVSAVNHVVWLFRCLNGCTTRKQGSAKTKSGTMEAPFFFRGRLPRDITCFIASHLASVRVFGASYFKRKKKTFSV